jgi:hypothetical protein
MGLKVMTKTLSDSYNDEEAQRRFKAALRGAREVGHEPMKDFSPKESKPHDEMKLGRTSKQGKPPNDGRKERPASKGRVHKGKSKT